MPLPTFKTLDEIPEAFRSEYEEKDGQWVPKELTGLKSALQKEREAREAAEKAAREARKAADELETAEKGRKAGINDETLAQLRAELDKKLEPVAKERDEALAKLRTLQLDGAVKGILAKGGVRPERLDVFWSVIRDRFELTAEGTPILKGDATADLSKVASETLKKEFPEFYAAPAASGGGANPSGVIPKGADGHKLLLSNPLALLEAANKAA